MTNYTKYLSALVNDQGAPNLSQADYKKLMNVVYLEGKLEGLSSATKMMSNTNETRKFDLKMFDVQKQITLITGNLEPKEFIRLMLE
tara:strand:+ start:240 stop:500 length:261 start_codon:yes stop_codon:yes gene_type:complete